MYFHTPTLSQHAKSFVIHPIITTHLSYTSLPDILAPIKLQLRADTLSLSLARRNRTVETKLRGHAVDAVGRVEVLDDDNLEAGRGALAGGNG